MSINMFGTLIHVSINIYRTCEYKHIGDTDNFSVAWVTARAACTAHSKGLKGMGGKMWLKEIYTLLQDTLYSPSRSSFIIANTTNG